MVITSKISTIKGEFAAEYHDVDSFHDLPYEQCTQVYGVCFYQDSIILAKTIKGSWILPGGTIEAGEAFEQTLTREVREESNMRVLFCQPIGYQKLWNEHTAPIYQLRYYCEVEPFGPFEKDMAEDGGNIASIWQIVPDQVADLLNWGTIGERIIEKATTLHYLRSGKKFDNQT